MDPTKNDNHVKWYCATQVILSAAHMMAIFTKQGTQNSLDDVRFGAVSHQNGLRLPTSWSSSHETAWEWLWSTISRNLREGTQKAISGEKKRGGLG